MVDIVLVHPGGVHGINPVYGDLSKSLTSIEQPLWCRLIAGYLLERGWTVKIIDQEAEQLTTYDIAEICSEQKARIVAIVVSGHQPSASTQSMVMAREVAEELRERDGYKPITVMLGNHPSALPERTLREEPVDFVIDGEGPVTLDRLLNNDPKNDVYLSYIPGLVWRTSKGEIVKNPLAPLIDLKELHGDVWQLLPPFTHYRAHAWQCLEDQSQRTPYAAIYTSLGCSYKCDFCMINSFQKINKYRRRDPEQVVEEICSLYAKGVRTFKIIDELFVLNRQHYYSICSGIIAAGIGRDINIWAYARTDTVHASDLPLLRAAGIKWLALGIESGDADIRGESNKALRNDSDGNATIKDIVRKIQAADINVIGNYIFGLPGDTHASMQRTLDLALELNTEFANLYCAQAYPGSPLYDRVAKDNPQDLPPSWAAYSQHNRYCTPLRTEHLTAAEILKFRDEAFITYFTSPNWRSMALAKFGQGALDHIDAMLSFKLERDLLKELT